MRKNQRGITLIALVITIIVILILASITIGTLTGDNSIIDKANEAKTATELAGAREKVEAEYIMCLERGELNEDKFRTNLKNSLGIEDKDIINNGDGTWTIKYGGIDINAGDKIPFGPGVLVAETENEEWIDKDGDKAIIPGGFGIIPGQDDVSEGLVITDEFDASGNSIGNEFVWIPVEDATGGTTPMAYAKGVVNATKEPIYAGKAYRYYQSNVVVSEYNYYEPDLALYYDNLQGKASYYLGMSADQLNTQMQNEFNNMIKSVKQYRWFLYWKV